MTNFAEFMKKNREKAYAAAWKNTQHDSEGRALIARDSEWAQPEPWDEYYRRMVTDEGN